MRAPEFLKRSWHALGAASTVAWLLSLGLGGVLSSILADAIDLGQPWRTFFFVGMFLVVTAVTLPLTKAGFAVLAGLLPQVPAPTIEEVEASDRAVREERLREEQEEQRRRTNRAAIHESMTTLEYHKADVAIYGAPRTRNYQGSGLRTGRHLPRSPVTIVPSEQPSRPCRRSAPWAWTRISPSIMRSLNCRRS